MSVLYFQSNTQEKRRYRVRSEGLRNCGRTQHHHQDCSSLLGNGGSYKTHAAGSTFSPVNHNCKHICLVQTAHLIEWCWPTLIWVCWASTHLEVELPLGHSWKEGDLDFFLWMLCRVKHHGSFGRSGLVTPCTASLTASVDQGAEESSSLHRTVPFGSPNCWERYQ